MFGPFGETGIDTVEMIIVTRVWGEWLPVNFGVISRLQNLILKVLNYYVPINVWGGSYSGNRNTLAVHPHQLNTQHFRIMDLDKLTDGTWKVKKKKSEWY